MAKKKKAGRKQQIMEAELEKTHNLVEEAYELMGLIALSTIQQALISIRQVYQGQADSMGLTLEQYIAKMRAAQEPLDTEEGLRLADAVLDNLKHIPANGRGFAEGVAARVAALKQGILQAETITMQQEAELKKYVGGVNKWLERYDHGTIKI